MASSMFDVRLDSICHESICDRALSLSNFKDDHFVEGNAHLKKIEKQSLIAVAAFIAMNS